MNCFPIVHRELRIASRKKATFRIRIIAAAFAVVIGGFGCLIAAAESSTRGVGKAVLSILTTITVYVALGSGIFLTSDCISEEKREGTLGLLFLTDLRGYDVVSGKLFSTSLRALYGVLAIFPVLAVTLLMGGVSGAEFWKTTLALLNALFFSLTLGLLVSSTGRDSQTVMGRTFGLLLVFNAAFPAIDRLLNYFAHDRINLHLSLASPLFVFRRANGYAFSDYWSALFITHAMAWTFLGVAAVIVPRSWQERDKSKAGVAQTWRYAWRYGNPDFRLRLRHRLLDINPVLWLTSRQRFQSLGPWFMCILLGFVFILPLVANSADRSYWTFWYYLTRVLMFALYLRVATQASRFFLEARRNGSIELLLGGPLTSREIVTGQWKGLLRAFGGPVYVIAALDLAAAAIATASQSPAPGLGNCIISGLAGCASAIALMTNVAGMAWLGMRVGITSKSLRSAGLKTVLLGEVLPAAIIAYLGLMVSESIAGAYGAATGHSNAIEREQFHRLIASMLTIGKNAAIIATSRQWLYLFFRDEASKPWAATRSAPSPSALPAWPLP